MIGGSDATMVEMDALLRRAAASITYPATPDISSVVASRLQTPESRRVVSSGLRVTRERLVAAFAAAVVAAFVVVLSVPQSRQALADFFGLSHVRVQVESVPTSLPTVEPEDVARPVSLAEAQALVDFPIRQLRTVEAPSDVYVLGDEASSAVVIFSYDSLEFDLYQSRGAFFGKGLPDETFIHEVQVNGHNGLWIEPGHSALFEGSGLPSLRRTIDRGVLFWQEGGITLRLETSLSQEEALRVAGSIR